MLIKGDKIRLTKAIANFNKVGDIFTVNNITEDGAVAFSSYYGCGVMSLDEFEDHFEKYIEKPKTVEEMISELIDRVNDLEDRVETLEDHDF